MKHLAMIPARSGSKRIANKNIRDFLGKPIISYSIDAALKSKLFDEVMVSTDAPAYRALALQLGAKVPFLRSSETSNDFAGTAEVISEVLTEYSKLAQSFDYVTVIYPTALFVTSKILADAFAKLNKDGLDSVLPAVQYSYPIQRCLVSNGNGGYVMKWPENYTMRSQDCEKTFHDAGQFYCLRVSSFLNQKKLFMQKMDCLILNPLNVQDIDSEADWKIAEMKFKLATGASA